VSVFCTTTDPDVDPETRSRFLVTGIDESRSQTRRILDFKKSRHSLEGMRENLEISAVRRKHRNFQRLLKPCRIVNPFAGEIDFCDDRLQGRRAQPQFLNIINAVAFLHQMQKEVETAEVDGEKIEYIEVDRRDLQIGSSIAVEILGRSLDELSIPSRNLLEQIYSMVNERLEKLPERDSERMKSSDITFTRRDIREYTGWRQTRLRTHLVKLIEMEYVLMISGGSGRKLQRYSLIYDGQGQDGEKFIPGLKTPENSGISEVNQG
jgi:hypothetical protein